MGLLGILGTLIFIWAHTIDQMQKFDGIHTLELKLWQFEVSHYVCIGKLYVCNVHAHALRKGRGHAYTNVMTITRYVKNCTTILLVPGYTFQTIIFLLSVWRSLEKKKLTLNNLICGTFGSTWGQYFYMDTQNGSKLEA